MLPFSLEQTGKNDIQAYTKDEWLFGWNPLPGIVSVWANSNGLAII